MLEVDGHETYRSCFFSTERRSADGWGVLGHDMDIRAERTRLEIETRMLPVRGTEMHEATVRGLICSAKKSSSICPSSSKALK